MRTFIVLTLASAAVLAGCEQQAAGDGNGANSVIASAETRTGGGEPNAKASGPVDRETALRMMKERHDGMEAIGDETKKIGNQLKSSAPDVAAIQQSAGKIAELAPKAQGWFPAGSGPDVGKTRAKAEIWQKPGDYASKMREFEQAAAQLKAAADSGDLSRIKATFATMGKTCKACHDSYRSPEDDH